MPTSHALGNPPASALPSSETPLLQRQRLCHSEADTAALANALAAQPALRTAFLTLYGDLGAGKTTLVRHLLRALGVSGRIKSPTYAVVEPHEGRDGSIWHFDFYRFNAPREWEDAGFRDLFATPGLKLAEWPNQAAGLLPPADIAITIEAIETINDNTEAPLRRITLDAHTPLGAQLLRALPTI